MVSIKINILLAFLISMFLSVPVHSAAIEWQVVQPFRFLRYNSDHKIHELAWEVAEKKSGFKTRPVSVMEGLLNDPTWWSTPLLNHGNRTPIQIIEDYRSADLPNGQSIRTPERFDPRLGWASLLRVKEDGGVDVGTCWNADRQDYLGCISDVGDIRGGEQYVHPEHHIVSIGMSGLANDGNGQTCRLEVTGALSAGFGFLEGNRTSGSRELSSVDFDCSQSVLARVPYKENLAITAIDPEGGTVSEVIEVRDFLVASLGDSFASGEGNPEVIAKLDSKEVVTPRTRPDGTRDTSVGYPKRIEKPDGTIRPGTHARWLDQRCHRSIYSSHARAAIALALAGDGHHAVTYVSYACSGAEITNGLFWSQDGRECTGNSIAGMRHLEPQLSAMVNALRSISEPFGKLAFTNTLDLNDHFRKDELRKLSQGGWSKIKNEKDYCKNWPNKFTRFTSNPTLRVAHVRREIDLLYLGIGGNDIGFAPLLTGMILTQGFTKLPLQDKMAKFYSIAAGGIDKDEAEDRLDVLPVRYEMLKKGIISKLEIDENDLGSVFLTEYPNPSKDENGALCDSGRTGMNVSKLFNLSGPGSSKGLTNISEVQSVIDQLNATVRSNSDYTIVGDFMTRFENHGICADRVGTNDEFDLPFKTSMSSSWNKFDPLEAYYPYASRQRWFRTFNDSYLSIQFFKENAYEEEPADDVSALYLAYRSLGGPVHPSAEGHAAIADSLYCASIKKVLAGQTAIQCN